MKNKSGSVKVRRARRFFIISSIFLFIFFLIISFFLPIISVKIIVYCVKAPCYPIPKKISLYELMQGGKYLFTPLTYFTILMTIVVDIILAVLINFLISLIYEKFINYKNKRILIKKR